MPHPANRRTPPSRPLDMIRRIAVYILLVSVYGVTWLIAVVGKVIPHRRWRPNGRILVTGAFHNPNWYLSHVTPLAHSGVKEVILVVDEPQPPFENVRSTCPPKWVSILLGRVGARSVWTVIAGLRHRPDLYMGYYLAPGACSALIAGRLFGRPSCYQMTGGPSGIIGGGFASVESVEGLLGRPSRLIEALALGVVRQFDLVVVRGNRAKEFLAAHGITRSVAVITGSVQKGLPVSDNGRDIHLIFVGRLSLVKQVDQFIAVVDASRYVVPDIHAVIVGEGPLRTNLQARANALGLRENIEFIGQTKDVEPLLARSKVFVLTSKSEGLSIAMIEAMAAGVVPVVADVGELGDLVADGVNGYLVAPNDLAAFAAKVLFLLQNEGVWHQYSQAAIQAAGTCCDLEVVSTKWRQHLREVVARASRCPVQDILN